jgi:TatD DNase family protein
MRLVDSHCHIDGKPFESDREAVIARARAAGVETIVVIGGAHHPEELERAIRLAETHPFVYAAVGVHPHEAAKAVEASYAALIALTAHPKVVAVGEIGLDYHYNFSPPEVQREVFVRQLGIAREASKLIVIHTREAWADTFALLEEHWGGNGGGGIMHCFSGGPVEVERSLALGFHISFSGMVTYPKADEVRAAARLVPQDRLLVETDAPYLAPVPHRGKRNEPAFVVETARRLAEIRRVDPEDLAEVTSLNWRRLCLRGMRSSG